MHTPPSETSPSDFKIPLLIGVVGHRDLVSTEVADVRAVVARMLKSLRDDHPDVPLRLLCSMAAGADLLVADIAAELGLDIVALLPYARQLCREDLESELERKRFDRLCELSDVVELSLPEGANPRDIDHAGELRDRQLQRAGSLVARYSGVMIAIWNGLGTDHRAGTARAIEFRRLGVMPTDEPTIMPRDVLLSPRGDDLNFEVRCSRVSHPQPSGVTVLGYTGSHAKGGEAVPHTLTTTLQRLAAFNRDIDQFGGDIREKGRRLSQPSPSGYPRRWSTSTGCSRRPTGSPAITAAATSRRCAPATGCGR